MRAAGDIATKRAVLASLQQHAAPATYTAREIKQTVVSKRYRLQEHVKQVTSSLELTCEALRMYRTLYLTALYTARNRGYARLPDQLTMLIPTDALAWVLERDPKTVRKYRAELVAAGLVAARTQFTTYKGFDRRTGVLMAVSLDLQKRDRPLAVSFDDLRACHRDLAADINAGKTCWKRYKNTIPDTDERLKARRGVSELLIWTLPPASESLALLMYREVREKGVLHDLLTLPGVAHKDRRAAVNRAAQGLARHLGALHNLNFYRSLCWQALRLAIFHGIDLTGQLFMIAEKTAADAREGFATNAAKLFYSRLKRSGHLATLMDLERCPVL